MIGVRPIQADHVPDALHQFGLALRDQFFCLRVTLFAITTAELHFEQLVVVQGNIELAEHAGRNALVANGHDRFERMRQLAQVTTLGRGKWHGSGSNRSDRLRKGIMRAWMISDAESEPVARSKSSTRWLREHFDDPFVKRAQAEGVRSRSTFKLEELIDRDQLLKPDMTVVDLGAAPGGWSQLVQQRLTGNGRILALDILPMQALHGVEILEGDFREAGVLAELERQLGVSRVDLVLSDMAPNMSGIALADQARSMELAELARDFALDWLRPGGAFLTKLFQGAGFDEYVRGLRGKFKRVVMRKPKASRSRSNEVYALATERKPEDDG